MDASLMELRARWCNALVGPDRNAIRNQLIEMTWDIASFRVISKAVELAPSDRDGNKKVCGLALNLTRRCFFKATMVAIRRLLDPGPPKPKNRKSSKKDVFSLLLILNEIKQNLHILTRRAIIEAEGLSYDYEFFQKEEYSKRTSVGVGVGESNACYVADDAQWRQSRTRHESLDELCGVIGMPRSPDDTFMPHLLDHLIERVTNAGKEIERFTNKYIAHAATPESRAIENATELRITTDEIWNAHQTLIEVASYVTRILLGESFGLIHPHAIYDHFEYIDQPLVAKSQVSVLEGFWEKFEDQCHVACSWMPQGGTETNGETGEF